MILSSRADRIITVLELIPLVPTWVWIVIGVILVLFIIGYFESKREIITNKKSIKLTKPLLPKFENDQELLSHVKEAAVQILVDGEEQGAGFVISEYGFVMTNNEHIEFKGKVQVRVINGEVYDAKIVHMDEEHKLALLKIKAQNCVALPGADSLTYETGNKVFAIGAPWMDEVQDNSVTTGIINTKRNSDGCKVLESDASINHQHDGGPLVNSKGEVVGINIFETIEKKEITLDASYTIDINHAFKRLKIRY